MRECSGIPECSFERSLGLSVRLGVDPSPQAVLTTPYSLVRFGNNM